MSNPLAFYRTKATFNELGFKSVGFVVLDYKKECCKPFIVSVLRKHYSDEVGYTKEFRGLGHAVRYFNLVKSNLRAQYNP